MSNVDDARRWWALAEEMQGYADHASDPDIKRELLVLVKAYQRLAEHVERTAGRKAARRV